MARKPTRGRNTNALLHAFGHLSTRLDQGRRADLLNRIEAYRRGHTPLSVPIALLSHHAHSDTLPWLADQIYLAPFPDTLRLRHSI